MRERHRLSSSFRPTTDELEKLVGVSSLAVGELTTAALAIVNQPLAIGPEAEAVVPANDAPESHTESTPLRRSTFFESLAPPKLVPVILETGGVSRRTEGADIPSALTAANAANGGEIRLLSLAPGEQPGTSTDTPCLPQRLGGSDVGLPNPIPVSIPNSTAVAAPVSDGFGTSPQSEVVVVAPGDGNESGVRPQIRDTPNSGGTIASIPANSARGSRAGGIPLANGYVATGGTNREAAVAKTRSNTENRNVDGTSWMDENQLSGGTGTGSGPGSGTGMGTGTGTGSATTSGSSNPSSTSGTSETGGTYSIPGAGGGGLTPSGGSSPAGPPTTGRLFILSEGENIVGGVADFDLSGGGSVSNITWSASGTPLLESGETVPDPAEGQTDFDETTYDISSQTGQIVNFLWGEKPGVETLKATATVTANGNTTTVTATTKVKVIKPNWSVKIDYLEYATISPRRLSDALDYSDGGTPGISWSATTTSPGVVDVVQIVTGGSITKTNPPGPDLHGLMDTSTTPATPASFPLVDVSSDATGPFYGSVSSPVGVNNDSPAWTVTTGQTTRMALQFKDYIMYSPNGSPDWVPVASFRWNINFIATPTGSKWTPSGTAIVVKPTSNTSFPTWNDVSYKYLNWA